MAGIYIHIPFCQKKCPYCDFYSVVNAKQMGGFVKALHKEISNRAYELEGQQVTTIYFGGGTPSMLSYKHILSTINLLGDYFDISPDAEVTMECNPGDVSGIEIHQLVRGGVNRFSIGAQSFDDRLLKTLGRRHSAGETMELYRYIRDAGIQNISIDLIYSIPGQDLEMLERDLEVLMGLDPVHVSAYDLIYEQGTPFFEMRKSGVLTEVSESLSVKMAHTVRRTLSAHGYEHYEISNFAKPGFRSIHNSGYWTGTSYLGFGPSAHSFVAPWRSWNAPSLEAYNTQLLNGAQFLVREYEMITPEMAFEEYVMTRLRTAEGISTEALKAQGFPIPSDRLTQLVREGYLIHKSGPKSEPISGSNSGFFALSDFGLDYADKVILDLISSI